MSVLTNLQHLPSVVPISLCFPPAPPRYGVLVVATMMVETPGLVRHLRHFLNSYLQHECACMINNDRDALRYCREEDLLRNLFVEPHGESLHAVLTTWTPAAIRALAQPSDYPMLPPIAPIVLQLGSCVGRNGLLVRDSKGSLILDEIKFWTMEDFVRRTCRLEGRSMPSNPREHITVCNNERPTLASLLRPHPFQCFYDATMKEPRPTMPEEARRLEQIELQAVIPNEPTTVIVRGIGCELPAVLELDGTFSIKVGNETHKELTSFALLWYLKQHARQTKAQGVIRLLQPAMARDRSFALGFVYFAIDRDMSLRGYIEEEFKNMPGLVTLSERPAPIAESRPPPRPSLHAILDRLQAKHYALTADLAALQQAERLQEENRVLEESIRTLVIKLAE